MTAIADRERRNGTVYLTGLGCSMIGNSALSLVAGIWVKSLTGSSSAAAVVSVCIYAPSLLGPLAGLLADRVRQRRLLIILDLASAAVVGALLLVRSRNEVWLIYLVALWYGSTLALSTPAESALFGRMFSPETRARVNGRSVALQEIGRLVSPLAGAAVFAAAGGGVVAVIDAATFLVGASATALLRVDDRSVATSTTSSWRTDVTAGVRYVWSHRELRTIAGLAAAPMLLSGLLVAAQYSVVDALDRPPSFLGVLSACLGAGSIVASLAAGRLIARVGERATTAIAIVNFIAGCVLRSTGHLVPVLLGCLVLGAALPWSLIALITAGQRLTPAALQGRVSAAITLLMFAPQPLTQALGAVLLTPIGYRAMQLAVAAVLTATLLVAGARHGRHTAMQSLDLIDRLPDEGP